MGKNIVLCSDGTGNKGGSGSDTNVFKVYNAVQVNDVKPDQVVFYDNGVGTSKLNLQKALGGGLGLGFRQNVRDLYEYLGRNYEPGDDIYLFGFSRGAATVRAFAGMLEHCGLVVKHRRGQPDINEEKFQKLVDKAITYYKHRSRTKKLGFKDGTPVTVEFMGVWDTVAALGTPQLPWLDNALNLVRRHKFYDYDPATCVKNVYHAIAVDDQRRTFWPMVWNEKKFQGGGKIEQVWFAGMHSNVGGGYPREELAEVALDWMMQKLEEHCEDLQQTDPDRGLCLKKSAMQEAREDAYAFGKLYDSRGGLSIFYRYQPRPIEMLCEEADTPIRIHESVVDRLQMRTAGYTPGNLPGPGFEMIATHSADTTTPAGKSKEYDADRAVIDRLKNARVSLYWVFLMSSLAALGASVWLWLKPAAAAVDPSVKMGAVQLADGTVLHWVEAGLRYLTPTVFDNVITYLVVDHPSRLLYLLGYAVILYGLRVVLQMSMESREETARQALLTSLGRST